MTFQEWWHNTGSGIGKRPEHDNEEHAHLVSKAAWDACSASPWKYPSKGDPMPEEGQDVLLVIRYEERFGVSGTFYVPGPYSTSAQADVILERWMPVPEVPESNET